MVEGLLRMSISPHAIVSPGAVLGRNVTVGPWTLIHSNTVLGDNTTIESHCEIGHPTPLAEGRGLVIGADSLIRSHSVFYEGSTFGPGLVTGHRVTVRERLEAGVGLQIGTLSDFQGHATIGDYVRTHSNVHIGQGSKIGSFVWIFPYTVLTNDPHPPSEVRLGVTVEDYAVIATMVVLLPGVTVGSRSLVGAHSLVSRDVPSGMVAAGVPARVVSDAREISMRDGSGRPAYPWTRHFHRGYPEERVREWMAELP
jgi:acetyltransferase-like isoleucine patch superfamily enzyme